MTKDQGGHEPPFFVLALAPAEAVAPSFPLASSLFLARPISHCLSLPPDLFRCFKILSRYFQESGSRERFTVQAPLARAAARHLAVFSFPAPLGSKTIHGALLPVFRLNSAVCQRLRRRKRRAQGSRWLARR